MSPSQITLPPDAPRPEAIRAKIQRALDDPRPSISAEQVFDEIDAMLAHMKR